MNPTHRAELTTLDRQARRNRPNATSLEDCLRRLHAHPVVGPFMPLECKPLKPLVFHDHRQGRFVLVGLVAAPRRDIGGVFGFCILDWPTLTVACVARHKLSREAVKLESKDLADRSHVERVVAQLRNQGEAPPLSPGLEAVYARLKRVAAPMLSGQMASTVGIHSVDDLLTAITAIWGPEHEVLFRRIEAAARQAKSAPERVLVSTSKSIVEAALADFSPGEASGTMLDLEDPIDVYVLVCDRSTLSQEEGAIVARLAEHRVPEVVVVLTASTGNPELEALLGRSAESSRERVRKAMIESLSRHSGARYSTVVFPAEASALRQQVSEQTESVSRSVRRLPQLAVRAKGWVHEEIRKLESAAPNAAEANALQSQVSLDLRNRRTESLEGIQSALARQTARIQEAAARLLEEDRGEDAGRLLVRQVRDLDARLRRRIRVQLMLEARRLGAPEPANDVIPASSTADGPDSSVARVGAETTTAPWKSRAIRALPILSALVPGGVALRMLVASSIGLTAEYARAQLHAARKIKREEQSQEFGRLLESEIASVRSHLTAIINTAYDELERAARLHLPSEYIDKVPALRGVQSLQAVIGLLEGAATTGD